MLEQVLDAGRDPTVKERLLSGRVNAVTCPHCGFSGMISTPLFYHDPEKQLALAFVPMELNLEKEQRERLIGDMTQAVMRGMPEDAPKGYLLQPQVALTLQGVIDQVLEADGITREMVDQERRKIEIIGELASASAEEADLLLDENAALIDVTFLELLRATAQAASQQGQSREALRLLNLRTRLLDTTEAGKEVKAQEDALREASQELQALGDSLTRESFINLLVEAADNPAKVDAFGMIGQGLLDYQTFQVLANRIDAEQDDARKQQLIEVREKLLEIAAEAEKESRAVVERAVDTLRMLLSAPDIHTAIVNNLERIDQTFLQVLQANLEEARKGGNIEVSSRLKEIRDEVLAFVQAAAPPEIQFINELLSAESLETARTILQDRQEMVSEDLLLVMDDLADQLRQAGNEQAADRLDTLRSEATALVG
jgi:hypothetical protein